jgi:hypothetical protein
MAHSAAGGAGFGAGKKPINEKTRLQVVNTPLQVLPLAVVWLEQYSDLSISHDPAIDKVRNYIFPPIYLALF